MKKTIFMMTLTALMLMSVNIFAEEKAEEKADKAEVKELKAQTHCPVMGGVIDSSSYTDIQGQRVYHCCPGCSKSLKKDPDKFFKQAAIDGILFENIQTTCPVSGKELKEKESYLDHEGRRVYFCCEGCFDKFKAEPQKYLSLLNKKDSDK